VSEEQTAVGKQVAASSIGQPAEVANPWEALGQDVLGKAAQELLTMARHVLVEEPSVHDLKIGRSDWHRNSTDSSGSKCHGALQSI
jgi:hypothetical protein